MSTAIDNFTSNNWGQPQGMATGDLTPGNYVGVSGDNNLSTSIVFSNGGYVQTILLINTLGWTYELQILAQGPSGAFNSGYLTFTDAGGDEYSISIYDSSLKTHILTYTSENPNITTIQWHS